jgi:hypothetical protein
LSTSPSNSNVGILAAGIYPSLATLRNAPPPSVQRFARVLGFPYLLRFVPLGTGTDDGWTIIVPANGAGIWVSDRIDDQGPDVVFTSNAATLGIYGGPWQVIQSGALSADSTVTLDPTLAVLGDTKEVTRLDLSAHQLSVVNGGPGGGTLSTFPASLFGNQLFFFNGTDWLRRR